MKKEWHHLWSRTHATTLHLTPQPSPAVWQATTSSTQAWQHLTQCPKASRQPSQLKTLLLTQKETSLDSLHLQTAELVGISTQTATSSQRSSPTCQSQCPQTSSSPQHSLQAMKPCQNCMQICNSAPVKESKSPSRSTQRPRTAQHSIVATL